MKQTGHEGSESSSPADGPASGAGTRGAAGGRAARLEVRIGQQPPPGTYSLHRGPYSWVVLGLALASIASMLLALGWHRTHERGNEVAVLIATRSLPSYHVLTNTDVSLGHAVLPRGNVRATFLVAGSLTLRPISKGQPVMSQDVSVNVVHVLGPDVAVTGLSISHAAALGGTLSGGDKIQLLFGGRALTAGNTEAVILSVTGRGAEPGHEILVIALQEQSALRYGPILAAGHFAMVVPAAP